MKYYKKELWQLMHSSDEQKRKEAQMQFRISAQKYGPYFAKIKDELPVDFLVVFNENKWFHDFDITDIHFNNGQSRTTVSINISRGDIQYNLIFHEVTKFVVDVPNKEFWMPTGMKWGYTEFELLNNLWTINILCDVNCEIEIGFKMIEISKI